MSTIHADPGGEYYFSLGAASALTAGIWDELTGLSLVSTGAAGRAAASDGKIYAFSSSSGNQLAGKHFASNYSHMIEDYAVYTTTPTWQTGSPILAFTNGTAVTTTQCDIRMDANGHLVITRNGTVLGTSTVSMTAGWNYVELDVTCATGATGAADAWLNGVRVLHLTSVQTAITTATANRAY